MRSTLLAILLVLITCGSTYANLAQPQVSTGSVRGTVADPSGALVPLAKITVSNEVGFSKTVTCSADGTFALDHLVPGRYSLLVTATGFASASLPNVAIISGKSTVKSIKLRLPVEQQQVQVDDQALAVNTASESNASAIIIKGKDLDALSDDPDQLQNELNALAGPSAGPNGGQISIDDSAFNSLNTFDIRGGYGWFYDRFNATYVLDAIRQNGTNQKQYVIKSPSFYQNAPAASELAASATTAPTIYEISPHMKAALNMQAAVGVEHQFGKVATASATYINSRGVHQYLSSNVNADLPGTVATGTGTRPNGLNENIYQFQSGGVYNQNQLIVNYTLRASRAS
jgi:hypothetical protein